MQRIKKSDMAARVSRAADSAPSIEQRLRHAQSLAHTHPIPDSPVADYPDTPAKVVIPGQGGGLSGKTKRFMTIDASMVDENPFNARKIYRPERVSQLAASIMAHGQEVPGIATERNGRFVLAAAHYRLRAIKLCGVPTIDLMVYDGLSDRDLFEFSYRENAEREDQSALDNALSWRNLLDEGVYPSETALAEATSLSLPNINKTLKILDLSNDILDLIKENPAGFALSALYELVLFQKVAGATPALELAMLLNEEKIGRKEIQEARARIEAPKERKRKETSRPYPIKREGAYSGSLKVFGNSGRVMLDLTFTDESARTEALAELKAKFGVAE